MSKRFIGEIQEVYHYENRARYKWIVPEFFSIFSSRWKYSPTFTCFGFLYNFDSFNGRLALCMTREGETLESVRISIGISMADGSELLLIHDRRVSEVPVEVWPPHDVLDLSDLERLGRYLPLPDKVTITCTIFRPGDRIVVSSETQTEDAPDTDGKIDQVVQFDLEDLSILRDHYKDLQLCDDDPDVIITVKNKHFKVHKSVLRARSPVFEEMFRSKMKESVDGTLSIDGCDPEVFGELLRYIYTEKVEFQSASHAVGLYYASDTYGLSKLKEKSLEFLKISLSTTAISDVITLADRHGEEELLQQAIVYFSIHLEEIMLTSEWQYFLADNPVEANEMCLKAVQCLKASTRRSFPMNCSLS